jgi:hypothetical protein
MLEFMEQLQRNPWLFLPVGYLFSIAIETPVLCVGLSPQHPLSRRVLAGIWLTACTYPFVVLVAPNIALLAPESFSPTEERVLYLAVAESVAHFGECLLFYLAFRPLQDFWRDMIAVFCANLASFGIGEFVYFLIERYAQE